MPNSACYSQPTYGVAQNVTATDVAHSIFSEVDSTFYDVDYPDREWPQIITPEQILSGINPGARAYDYIVRNRQGAAAFIGHGPQNDIPEVGQSIGAVSIPIAYAAVGATITNEDARQYAFGLNGNLAVDLGEAMREACENLIETSEIFGVPDLQFYGWIDYPGITVYLAAPSKSNPASTKWVDKTGEEWINDINTALTSVWENSRMIFKPTHIFLPLRQYSLLTQMPVTIGNTGTPVTVAEFIRRNNVVYYQTGRELEIRPSRYLAGAGIGCTDRMVIMDRSPRNQIMPFPLGYTLSEPRPYNLAVRFFAEMKFGSYHIKQQGSMAYVDGI